MIIGTSHLNIDAKFRMAIPTKYRPALLAESEGKMVVTASPDEYCLWLYTAIEWEKSVEKIMALPTMNPHVKKVKRMMIGFAETCVLDSAGRILLSESLRKYAGIGKKVSLVGQDNKFEVWSEEKWEEQCESMMSQELDMSHFDTLSF